MATAPLPARLLDDSFLRFLPSPLREPRRAWLVLPLAWCLTFIGSLLLAAAVRAVVPDARSLDIPNLPPWVLFSAFVIFSPVVESILMGGGLVLLLRFVSPAAAILTSAIVWGCLHSIQIPVWGLAIWWPFLIFSTLFVVWRQFGFWTGVAIATIAHMLQNLLPGIAIAFPGILPGLG